MHEQCMFILSLGDAGTISPEICVSGTMLVQSEIIMRRRDPLTLQCTSKNASLPFLCAAVSGIKVSARIHIIRQWSTHAAGFSKETAIACIRLPLEVSIPGQIARRSTCGEGVSGRMRVVLPSLIHVLAVDITRKLGPNSILSPAWAKPKSATVVRRLKPYIVLADELDGLEERRMMAE